MIGPNHNVIIDGVEYPYEIHTLYDYKDLDVVFQEKIIKTIDKYDVNKVKVYFGDVGFKVVIPDHSPIFYLEKTPTSKLSYYMDRSYNGECMNYVCYASPGFARNAYADYAFSEPYHWDDLESIFDYKKEDIQKFFDMVDGRTMSGYLKDSGFPKKIYTIKAEVRFDCELETAAYCAYEAYANINAGEGKISKQLSPMDVVNSEEMVIVDEEEIKDDTK